MKRAMAIFIVAGMFMLSMVRPLAQNDQSYRHMEKTKRETATLAAGCFWCVEAVFEKLKGVENVSSGYSGGEVKNPSYKEVTRGNTGHAEAIQIQYDPHQISYEQLLEVFWRTHDPTTLNRQGADIGPQYRSVIFYHNQEQKKIARESKREMDQSGYFDDPIVTAVEPYQNFYRAEDYHQDFYRKNPNQPYCRINIDPKLDKLRQNFGRYLK